MMNVLIHEVMRISGGLAMLLFCASAAMAGQFTWNPASNGLWSTAGNWMGGAAPGAGGDPGHVLEFGGSGASTYSATNNLGTFQMNKLLLNSSSSVSSVLAAATSSDFLRFLGTSGGVEQAGSGAFQLRNKLDLASDVIFGGAGTGSVTLTNTITGSGSVTKRGSWMMILSSANTFTGMVTVDSEGGGVRVNHSSGMGANSVTVSNGILHFVPTFNVTAGAYRQVVVAGGISTNDGDFNIGTNGAVIIRDGGLVVASRTVESGNGTVPVSMLITNGGRFITRTMSYLGYQRSNSTMIATGAGSQWNMSGNSVRIGYQGSGNVLRIEQGGCATNATILVDGGNSFTANSGASLYGSLNVGNGSSGAYAALSGPETIAHLTGITVDAGSNVLDIADEARIMLSGSISVGHGSSLSVAGGVHLRGDSTGSTSGEDTRVMLSGSNTLFEMRSNTLYFAYTSARANLFEISGGACFTGQMIVGHGGTDSRMVITNGGRLITSTAVDIRAGFGSNNTIEVTGSGSSWDAQNQTINIGQSGPVTHCGVIVRNGGLATNINTIIIASGGGSNNHLTVDAGRLYAQAVRFNSPHENRIELSGASEMTVAATLTVTNALNRLVFNGGTLNLQNAAINNGVPLRAGDGTQPATLNVMHGGTCTVASGAVITNGAKLMGGGTLAANTVIYGTLAPGSSVGEIAVTGNVELRPGARTVIEISDSSSCDRLKVTGDLAVSGSVEVFLLNDHMPLKTEIYVIMTNTTANAITGNLESSAQAWNAISGKRAGTFSVETRTHDAILRDFRPLPSGTFIMMQ